MPRSTRHAGSHVAGMKTAWHCGTIHCLNAQTQLQKEGLPGFLEGLQFLFPGESNHVQPFFNSYSSFEMTQPADNPPADWQKLLRQAANALLLKVNQIGSITEAITAYLDSVSTNWGVMVVFSADGGTFWVRDWLMMVESWSMMVDDAR